MFVELEFINTDIPALSGTVVVQRPVKSYAQLERRLLAARVLFKTGLIASFEAVYANSVDPRSLTEVIIVRKIQNRLEK